MMRPGCALCALILLALLNSISGHFRILQDKLDFVLVANTSTFSYDSASKIVTQMGYGRGNRTIRQLDADPARKFVCLSEFAGKKSKNNFFCAAPTGNITWESPESSSVMKIDELTGKLYWSTFTAVNFQWKIHVTDLSTQTEIILMAGFDYSVEAIAVDASSGFMARILKRARSGARFSRTLERSSMDGSNSRPSLELKGGTLTDEIALDRKSKSIYAYANSGIIRAEYNGSKTEIVLQLPLNNLVSSLFFIDGYLLHFVRNSAEIIVFGNVSTGAAKVGTIALPFKVSRVLLPDGAHTNFNESQNRCANSSCSIMCIASEFNLPSVCACPYGYTLVEPRRTQCALENDLFVYATERSVYRMNVSEKGIFNLTDSLGINNFYAITKIAHWNDTVFWASQAEETIYSRSILRGKINSVITTGISRITGLIVDDAGGNLFWSDSQAYKIEVLNLLSLDPEKEMMRKTLVWDDIRQPVGLTIDYSAGYLFWSDHRNMTDSSVSRGNIQRISLDGSQRTTIIDDLDMVSMELFAKDGWLYWWKKDGAYKSKYDGSETTLVMNYTITASHAKGYNIRYHKDYLYWCDPWKDKIFRKQLNRTQTEVVASHKRPNIRDFIFASAEPISSRNPCLRQRYECSHFCLFNGDELKNSHCACLDGYIIGPDGRKCFRAEDYPSSGDNGESGMVVTMSLVFGFTLVAIVVGLVAFFRIRYRNRKWITEEEYQYFRNGRKIAEPMSGYDIAISEPLPESYIILPEDCQISEEKLGSGFFGVVFKGTWNNLPTAFKTLRDKTDENVPISVGTKKAEISALLAEVKILSYLRHHRHRYIVDFYGVDISRLRQGNVVIAMELAETSLGEYLQVNCAALQEDIACGNTLHFYNWCGQIAAAMSHLEMLKIVHEDLAPRNVLLCNNATIAKVGDFGLSSQLEDANYVRLGADAKLPWKILAPEVILNKKFATASDVWSFGLLVWMVFSPGMDPFPVEGNRGSNNARKIWQDMMFDNKGSMLENIRQPLFEDEMLLNIIRVCLQKDGKMRPSFESLASFFKISTPKISEELDMFESSFTEGSVEYESWDMETFCANAFIV